MKTVYSIVLTLLLATFVLSCKQNRVSGTGTIETISREVGSFEGIDIEAPIDAHITITEGAAPSIHLKGHGNVLQEIKTEVENGVLRIYKDDLIHFSNNEDIIAEITVPSINSLDLSGAADAELRGMLNTSSFKLSVSGAGDVKMDGINAEVFNSKLSGAGNLTINGGNVTKASYSVSGAGEIAAFPLQTKEATVSVTGVGDVELSVSDKLSASVAGAGDITYRGTPQLTTNITGAGSIEQDK